MHAESSFVLRPTGALEALLATTFDTQGRAVGQSSFEVETDERGRHLMRVTMTIEGGGSNISEATLAPIPLAPSLAPPTASSPKAPRDEDELGQATLQILEERSQARNAEGDAFPLLVIDHQKGRVSCYPDSKGPSEGEHIDIVGEDRVVNVPMQLLFLPLVRDEVDSLSFQIATCVPGPVLNRMIAVRGPTKTRDGREIIEIEYRPDLGKTVAWLASRLLPSFSFWFDTSDGQYMGHRMPLHRKGPEILLVRQGLTPTEIGVD
jgi:hypothetical protein